MKHLISTEVTKARVAKWLTEASPIDTKATWTEMRLALTVGEHTYLVVNDQVFQCAHCGHYDPKWSAVEVLRWFEENLGIKPHEVEIECKFS